MNKAEIIRLLDNVPDDEPLFLLRASDRVAPGLVAYYAGASEARGASGLDVAAARKLAEAMKAWPKKSR